MARSWRSFFRKSKDEEPEIGPVVATEVAPEVGEVTEAPEAEVPSAEEVLAAREEFAATEVADVEEDLAHASVTSG